MSGLEGLGILITRPEPQGGSLAHTLSSEGARCFQLPALDVVPHGDPREQRALLGPLDRYHRIVFVSANAVRFGRDLLEAHANARVIAVGPATARALHDAGLGVALTPEGGFDSEHLLETPDLLDVRGLRILIVRGVGGRELLADTLMQRGAEVTYAEVYERRCATPAPELVARLEEAWSHGSIEIVTATSGELLRCLHGMLTPRGRELLGRTPLLVGSARIGRVALELGLGSALIVAHHPDERGLIEALRRWREGMD